MSYGHRPSITVGLAAALSLGACAAPVEQAEDDDIEANPQALSTISSLMWLPSVGDTKIRIPVCFVNGTTTRKQLVQQTIESSWEAIDEYLGNTGYGVEFSGWGKCPSNTVDTLRVRFYKNITTSSAVLGTASVDANPGVKFLNSQVDAAGGTATIMHEFGHVLGFTHEFNRPDYTGTCPPKNDLAPDLGITNSDSGSIMSYTCDRTGSLTEKDWLGFAWVYGPYGIWYQQPMGLRHQDTSYFLISRGNVRAEASLIEEGAFELVNANQPSDVGNVEFGDEVNVIASDGLKLTAYGSGSSWIVGTSSNTDDSTRWTVAGRKSSGGVLVNDEVLLRNKAFLRYLVINSNGTAVTATTGDFFRPMHGLTAFF